MIWFAQAVGIFGFTLMALSTQRRTANRILVVGCIGLSLVSFHYLILGDPFAAVMNSTGIITGLLGIGRNRGHRAAKYAYWLIYPFVGYGYLAGDGLTTVLTTTGTILGVIGIQQRNLLALRVFAVAGGLFWLTFGIMVVSIGQIAFGIFFIGGHVLQIFKASMKQTPEDS